MTYRVQATPPRADSPISGHYLIIDEGKQYMVPKGELENLASGKTRLPIPGIRRRFQIGYIPPPAQSNDSASQVSAPISINRVFELIDEGAFANHEYSPSS